MVSAPPVGTKQPAPEPAKPVVPPTLREAAALRAKSFKEKYFSGANQKSAEDTDDAQRLREVSLVILAYISEVFVRLTQCSAAYGLN